MNVNEIIQNVENNCDVRVFVDSFAEDDEIAFFIPEEKAIGINPKINDNEAVIAIIHEVAHFVDIIENNNENRRDIDGEIIAFGVEEIVGHNAPVQGVISEVEQDVRESYFFNGVVSIDEDDIQQVAERVKIICNIF